MKAKRLNKSKKEVVHDIKAVQNAERMRKVIREKVFPFMLELNDTIGYTKIFMQTATTAVENNFNELQRTTKVETLLPRLREVFTQLDKKAQPEMDKYITFLELMKDETVFDFITMIQHLPRVIEGYFTHETSKKPILELPIDKILG